MRNWNFSILLLSVIYVQCFASLDDPVADSGIFMEDICRGVRSHKKLPSPFDPKGYFECFKGEAIEKLCPGRREFDIKLQRCGPSVKARPKVSLKEKLQQRKTSTLASKFQSLKPKIAKKTAETSDVKPRRFVREIRENTDCVGENNWKQLPHEDNCQKYYLCVNEVAYERDCLDEKWFDELLQKCVPPRESRCTHKVPEDFCEGVPNFFKLESPNYCEDYYMCVNDIAYFYRCDNDEWFDQKNQQCGVQDNVDCILYNPPAPPEDICDQVPNFKYVASPYNCEHYYQCIFDKPYFKKCSNKNWFHSETQSCRDHTEVECNIKRKLEN